MTVDAQITFLRSSDLVASRAFYEGILGFELVVDQGACHIYRVNDEAFVGVCERGPMMPAEGVIVTFVVDDVDGWCDRIAKGGWTIESGPEHNERFSIYHAFLRDPDGNLLEIQRFDDPDWATR